MYGAREHLSELLDFLDRLLYLAFSRKKETDGENLSMRGLTLTEREVEQAFGLKRRALLLPEEERKELLLLAAQIQSREEKAEGFLPFRALCLDFSLSRLESLALLLGAALCFHRKYERICGYLQDSVQLWEPTRGLCLSLAELLEPVPKEEQAVFLAGGGNLELLVKTPEVFGTGLGGSYRLTDRVRNFLYGIGQPEACLRERLDFFPKGEPLLPLEIRGEYLERLERLFSRMREEEREESALILLHGPKGIGKRFLMKHLAARRGELLLFFDMGGLRRLDGKKREELRKALLVETVLSRACLCLTEEAGEQGEDGPEENPARKELLNFLGGWLPCLFLLSEEKEEQLSEFAGEGVSLELPPLSPGERIRLWRAKSRGYALEEAVDLKQNGNKYILTPQGIGDVLATARLLADMEGRERIGQAEIREAVKQNQKNQLGEYAALISSRFTWEDLILGEEQKRQMRMVCDQIRYRDVVGEKWGFHKKTPYGRGLSVMFYGPPGTGKTMAAQVMANELGLDLYRIDISQMVSKYIGETQKNISRLFQKAKNTNALLFFDEADSLFAKRSEAKDSNDRNANAETAHLLQKLEDYEGITVLATNYLNNIDDAFKRRLKFIIHIAFPEPEVRLKLWRSMLPAEAELSEELDLAFFAEHFELSGSSIKEIMTNAAYLAAAGRRGIANRDLVEAVRLNYAKYGKVLSRSDFGYLG